MAGTQVQRRRGSTAEHATFAGAVGEVTVDLTKKTLVVHDGVTPGGFPVASQAQVDAALATKQASDAELSTLAGMSSSRATFLASNEGLGFRNRIINGGMVIDQRNAGASVSLSGLAVTYTLDRWAVRNDTDAVVSVQQSSTAPTGFNNSLLYTVTTADSSLGAAQNYSVQQRIEGFNMADFGWGTASAQTVTFSFWVRSSLTGTFGGAVSNSAANRSYPFTYTISVANTWEQKTVTIAGDTSGTWLTTNGVGAYIYWSTGTGTTYSGTAGAWAAADYRSATGATSVVGTSGATFYITGVQLEAGSVASPFERRDYGRELMMCQRYYLRYSATSSGPLLGYGAATSTTEINAAGNFPVEMRTSPTFDFSSIQASTASGSGVLITSNNGNTSTTSTYRIFMGASAGGLTTNTTPYFVRSNGTGWIAFSSEL
jgi:hypothetical protein